METSTQTVRSGVLDTVQLNIEDTHHHVGHSYTLLMEPIQAYYLATELLESALEAKTDGLDGHGVTESARRALVSLRDNAYLYSHVDSK